MVRDYKPIFIDGFDEGEKPIIAIRKFKKNEVLSYLTVNPFTFETQTVPATSFSPRKKAIPGVPGYLSCVECNSSPYMTALALSTQAPYILENYGVQSANSSVDGVFLTVDMCPSMKPFEKELFDTLVEMADEYTQPVPVAIAMSGLWVIGHEEEFKWLLQKQKEGKLDITWINHSYSHRYYNDLSFDQNFLLAPRTNMDAETFDIEQILLEKGETPSIFFRFPGLVSNEKWIQKLNEVGLIPLGTNAWIGKGETPQNGSIILIHGNSNEHHGIVGDESKRIEGILTILREKRFKLLPLSRLFSGT